MTEVWVLTQETGAYENFDRQVIAVASTVERAQALAAEAVQRSHEAAVKGVMAWRQAWPQEREKRRAQVQHPADCGCTWCTHVAKPVEAVYPLPTRPTLIWEQDGDGVWGAIVPGKDEDWAAERMTVDRLPEEAS